MAALGVQLALYTTLLQRPIAARDLEQARPAITRWVKTAIAYQAFVVIASGAYVAIIASGHPRGLAWVAPPVGAVVGTALPLQIAVMSILRAGRRL